MRLSQAVYELVEMEEKVQRELQNVKDKRRGPLNDFLAEQYALQIDALEMAIRALVDLPEVTP